MIVEIRYLMNHASIDEIVDHLIKCDDNFVPRLSSRVNMNDYAKKIFQHAERLEAWDGNQLVGLTSVYMNDPEKKKAFISNVSVLQGYGGKGIATNLVEQCIHLVKTTGIGTISLEVSEDNAIAMSIYKKMRFVADKKSENNTLSMSRHL